MRGNLKFKNKLFLIFITSFFILIVSFLIGINKNILAQSVPPPRTCACYEYPEGRGACVWNDPLNFCGDGWQPDCHDPCTSCTCVEVSPGPGTEEPLDFDRIYDEIGSEFNTTTTIGDILSKLLLYIFPVAGLVLLLFILIGGFRLMFSGGNPKSAQSARSVITTAFIGFIIIFLAYWLTRLIATILGLGQIKTIF